MGQFSVEKPQLPGSVLSGNQHPVIILGSGASAAHGIPGMLPLATHLLGLSSPDGWLTEELDQWSAFCKTLQAGTDLETALGSVRLSERQQAHVVAGTRDFLLPPDEAAFTRLLSDRRFLPLTRLYKHLFTSVHRVIDVITPNYDRLAEYAADAGEFSVHTGFSQGYLQVRSKERPAGRNTDTPRTVRIWKVHGSLDWFRNLEGSIIGARAMRETPVNHTPLMITPGIDKYRLAHMEPFRTIFGCSDSALENARSYLCVGYGFNDEHLQTKLVERCENFSIPLLIISRTLTPTTRAFLDAGRCRKYLAIEKSHAGSRAYTNEVPAGFELEAASIWQLNEFLNLTIGDPV